MIIFIKTALWLTGAVIGDNLSMPARCNVQAIAGSASTLSGFLFAKLYHLRYTVDMEEKDKKITNEKPVSLYPLDFKEALAAFLQVKPKPKEEMDKAIKQKKTKEKKTSD